MTGFNVRVARCMERSVAHGPGERFVLWVQGCSLGCPGCFSAETHSFRRGNIVSVTELENRITNIPGIEGVTFTGGEPMQQARPLAELGQRLRDRGFSVMCYTGFTRVQLESTKMSSIRDLLAMSDILVDGRFVIDKAANLRWRGSSNQSVHFLTERYAHLRETADQTTHVEFSVTDRGFSTTGVWRTGLVEQIEQCLKNAAGPQPARC